MFYNMLGTDNVGYTVIAQQTKKNGDTYVLAFHPSKGEYVTWLANCTDNPASFAYGHYIMSFQEAVNDYNRRIKE